MVDAQTHPNDPFAGRLNRVGGELSLDFTNTVSWHGSPQAEEWFTDYDVLLAWARHAGALEPDEAAALSQVAAGRPSQAARALRRAIELREAIFRIFQTVGAGGNPESRDLDILNRALAEAYAHLELVSDRSGFVWRWRAETENLNRPLWPVARSAAELLASDRLERVKECAGEHCGWLFVDMSKNRSRRWCDMGDCGNRAKAKRHYERLRARLQEGAEGEPAAVEAPSATTDS
jgi:predicted RNA-binding Zn ribbon-like protein